MTEDRNTSTPGNLVIKAGWRSPHAVTEDRNYDATHAAGHLIVLAVAARGDRGSQHLIQEPFGPALALAVAARGDRGSQLDGPEAQADHLGWRSPHAVTEDRNSRSDAA